MRGPRERGRRAHPSTHREPISNTGNVMSNALSGLGDHDALKSGVANPDVAAAHINPLEHFLLFGAIEGRAANAGGWL
jgi:hypothetical protein